MQTIHTWTLGVQIPWTPLQNVSQLAVSGGLIENDPKAADGSFAENILLSIWWAAWTYNKTELFIIELNLVFLLDFGLKYQFHIQALGGSDMNKLLSLNDDHNMRIAPHPWPLMENP